MFKVMVSVHVQAYPCKNNECLPPMLTEKHKIIAVDAETAEEAKEKVAQFYEKVTTCLN